MLQSGKCPNEAGWRGGERAVVTTKNIAAAAHLNADASHALCIRCIHAPPCGFAQSANWP